MIWLLGLQLRSLICPELFREWAEENLQQTGMEGIQEAPGPLAGSPDLGSP